MKEWKEEVRRARVFKLFQIHKIVRNNMKWDTSHKFFFICKHLIRRSHDFYVYLVANRVVGVAIVKKQSSNEWYFAILVVEKSFRRRGYGRKLMRFVKNEAKCHNISKIYARVNAENPSLQLFEQEGFQRMTGFKALKSDMIPLFYVVKNSLHESQN